MPITDSVVGISTEFIATPINELKFYDPAICLDNDNDTQWDTMYSFRMHLDSSYIAM